MHTYMHLTQMHRARDSAPVSTQNAAHGLGFTDAPNDVYSIHPYGNIPSFPRQTPLHSHPGSATSGLVRSGQKTLDMVTKKDVLDCLY